jgi:hypothetical protein
MQAKRMRLIRSDQTLQQPIFDRHIPVGGLAALRRTIHDRINTWLDIACEVAREQPSLFTSSMYYKFTSLMYAAFYAFNVQGRQSGIEDMRWKQRLELLDRGFAHSRKFKTNARWGFQPVSIDVVSKRLLQLYIDVFRPIAVSNYRGPVNLMDGDAPFFLNFNGTAEYQTIGLRVSTFFKDMIDIKVSTTAIRSMVETEMHRAVQCGHITHEQLMGCIYNLHIHELILYKRCSYNVGTVTIIPFKRYMLPNFGLIQR